MFRALITAEAPLTTDELRADLAEAGIEIVAEISDPEDLAQAALRQSADLVVAAAVSPSPELFEAARLLGKLAPCPFVLFTSDRDTAKITRAAETGMHAYVVDGYSRHRLLSIIHVARARFRHGQVLRDELKGLSQRFDERKLVDRAKGMLMRSRGLAEEEAFELLRSLAMRVRHRIGVVAQSVIETARAGEAVNRSGQLRMLSQRIVKCYAQQVCGFEPQASGQALEDCIQRGDANLAILNRAISTDGYGELVERVASYWKELLAICAKPPDRDRLDILDDCAGQMLLAAETLTDFLGSSGLVPNLHILNVAGRQRMLSQQMTKLCFLLAVAPDVERVARLRALTGEFQVAMDHLAKLPLSSPKIQACLLPAIDEWARLRAELNRISEAEALRRVFDASERLLELTERLTDQYEQAMQILIEGRIGRLG